MAGRDGDEPRTTAGLRATAHPLRLSILSLLTGAEMSAAEVARELGLTHANASYHLRVLERAGLLTVVGEERIRGGVAKRYRHLWDAPASTTAFPGEHGEYVRAMADELVRRHGPGRRKGLLVDAEVWVDPEVWEEVQSLVRQASELVHRHARPPRTDGSVHVNLTAAAFRMDQP